MADPQIIHVISRLMNEVQIASMSDKDQFDSDFIDGVNNRIGEIEAAISELKYELTKHNLNDW